jgi:hypothetical protein
MPTALLIFIILITLAIGFFLGLFLISLNTPLTKSLINKKEEPIEDNILEPSPPSQIEEIKPSPESQLMLRVWKEEGKPPVYEQGGEYFTKEELPQEFLNVITIHEEAPKQQERPAQPVLDEAPTPIDIQELEDQDEIEDMKTFSVVDEVNDILQKKLIGSPLAGKGIHLMDNHKNEIRFWVGLNSYNDAEEIPDQEVRDIIKESVKEWERNRD